jgi:hypothetical protein
MQNGKLVTCTQRSRLLYSFKLVEMVWIQIRKESPCKLFLNIRRISKLPQTLKILILLKWIPEEYEDYFKNLCSC